MSGHEELRNSSDWQNQLYNRYHQKVFGICLYFLKDREEAKDASHDVFIKAFKAWKDFEWKCDPLTWIGAIAKHDCFSRRQRFRKQLDRRARLAMEEETLQNCEPEEDLLLHRMRLEKLMPAVRGKLKEILRLSLEQGLNHREIAVRMGVSRVAITRRLTRFKKELQGVDQVRDLAFARAQPRPKPRIRREVFAPSPSPALAATAGIAGLTVLEGTGAESQRHLIAA
ncbi:MAG TPA: sigma-70 family RNA polymerase sigma factor [Fibrobacteria bacterium]|nr:sigma-70 family RNA polymerase sigma factor [Fibrobacteria bacterium]